MAPVHNTSTRFSASRSAQDSTDLHLAGFQRAGMLDWPGKVVATAFLAGCNLACPYCHNPELVATSESRVDVEQLISHLVERRAWLDGVVITGGEPTLHEGLAGLCRQVRSLGLTVKLDTNGTRPAVLAELFASGLLDFVAVDVKATSQRYERATARANQWSAVDETISLVLDSGVPHEFRTTCYPPAVGPDDLVHIAARLCGAKRYVLQQFRPHRTLDAAALSVRPHDSSTLRRVAERCSLFVPTVVRGI